MADTRNSQEPAAVDNVLAERGSTYGPFQNNADAAQEIKSALRGGSSWHTLPSIEREALDLIATKLSRIVTGRPHRDNWIDIEGYARLVLR